MLASLSTLLLLAASAVSAQDAVPSVVTSIAISPSPASEEPFTIQTSMPSSAAMACDCIQEPCLACSSDGGIMSIPAGETPISTGNMASSISLQTSESAFPFIPPGETPIATGSVHLPTNATSSASRTSNGPTSSSGLAQQTSNAAVPDSNGEGAAVWAGLFVAAVALL